MRIELLIVTSLLLATAAEAQEEAISFPAAVIFETGDSWQYEDRLFRLFGVQSCVRGTRYRSPEGAEADCGMRSIGPIAALFSTETIACQPVGTAKDGAIFVVCAAEVGGETIDVGTALISSGAAFAAVGPSGAAVLSSYAVAETVAKESGNGLWAGEFIHPTALLLRATRSKGTKIDLQSLQNARDLPQGERFPGAVVE